MPGLTVKNRIGQRVGRLVVLAREANKTTEVNAIRACWLCQCDCGNTIVVTGHSLSKALLGKGGTRSCGCLMKEKPIKHGRCETRVYRIWNSMRQRCGNPKNPAYKSYGGRGIYVCTEWRAFPAFYADMGDPPQNHTLDRIDNSLGYSKANCHWATRKQQGNNRRTNTFLTYRGKKQTFAQWAEESGLGKYCLRSRLNAGWSIDKAISTPKAMRRASDQR